MASPTVRVNTFVQENDKIYIDPISKIFIISGAVFGFFRLPLIRERKLFYYLLAVFYVILLNGVLIYLNIVTLLKRSLSVMMAVNISRYIFCSIYGFVCIKRLQLYYITLNKFDMDVRYRPKVSRHSLQNLAQTLVTVIMLFIIYIVPNQLSIKSRSILHFLILNIAFTIEMDLYGHLLNILVPRLKLINYFIEASLSHDKSESSSLILNEFVSLKRRENSEESHYGMGRLMDLYHVVVEAYDYLIDAIKWQLLLSIIALFVAILGFLYRFSLNFIKSGQDLSLEVLWELSLPVLLLIPLFSPCTFGDKVHDEVKRLRELLASRLYEDKLDKSGRSVARALLAFTETRDLSFRLLRMLNIDISLPFKFMGLLVTYLIILLQFEKVLNPGTDEIQ